MNERTDSQWSELGEEVTVGNDELMYTWFYQVEWAITVVFKANNEQKTSKLCTSCNRKDRTTSTGKQRRHGMNLLHQQCRTHFFLFLFH
jgi:hypothetical protein